MICYRCAPSVVRWSSRPSVVLTATPVPSQLGKQWSRFESSSTSTSTTTTTTTTPPNSVRSTALANNQESPLNGPVTTRPAPIILPSRDANEKLFRFILRRAKIYLRFYKTGLVNIWHNYRRSEAISDMIVTRASNSLHKAVTNNLLTRSDYLLLHRSKHDISRLPLFGLVVIICGEFTPLVVPFITPLVPLTCRLPGQIDSAIRTLEERRRHSFRELTTSLPPLSPEVKVDQLRPEALRHISTSLGLHSRYWPSSFFPPPTWLLRRRVKKRVEYLGLDDTLLLRHAGPEKVVAELDPEEIQIALVERGLDTLGRNDGQRRELLMKWLGVVRRAKQGVQEEEGVIKDGVYARLLLTR